MPGRLWCVGVALEQRRLRACLFVNRFPILVLLTFHGVAVVANQLAFVDFLLYDVSVFAFEFGYVGSFSCSVDVIPSEHCNVIGSDVQFLPVVVDRVQGAFASGQHVIGAKQMVV